ncbi:FAD dependent oxidoreductase [Komagataeibacter xylinus E25]|nr:FAD dependent oxidoreductase [Komagataeibacter xylinus E25]
MLTEKWIDTSMKGVAWTRTCKEKRIVRGALGQDETADLVVVGGGFCGLTTAITAAKAGLKVIVLEGGIVGVGASGRTGGYAVPNHPHGLTPAQVEKHLGSRKGQAFNALVADGPNHVADLVRTYGIQSDYLQNGWTLPAHSKKSLAKVRTAYEEWKAFGAPIEWLDRQQVADETGASGYIAGWKSPTGAVVNPFAHSQGLARAAEQEGARIYEGTRVTGVDQQAPGQVVVTARVGGVSRHVRAGKVMIATNAYTDDLVPKLSKSIITLYLYTCATRPLPPELLKTVIPNKNCFTDLRDATGFGRLDVEGRLIAGGAVFVSAFNSRKYGLKYSRQKILSLFPQCKGYDIGFEDYWEGYNCITEAYLPHIQRLNPDVFSLLGCSTRGVSLMQNLGLLMGEFFGGKRELDQIPVELVEGVRTIWMQGVKTEIGRNIFPLFRLNDRLHLT